MKFFNFVGSVASWIADKFRNLFKAVRTLNSISNAKPKTKGERRRNKKTMREQQKIIIFSSAQILGVVCGSVLAFRVIGFFAAPIAALFWELWHGDITIRTMIFSSASILTIAGITALFYKLFGGKDILEEESESTYQFMSEMVCETVGKLQALGFNAPSHTSDLKPPHNWYYHQGSTCVYKFQCIKSRDIIDVEKIYRMFNDSLMKNQTMQKMGMFNAVNYNGALYAGITLIDIKESTDYITVELSLTSANALNIQRLRKADRRKKRGGGVGAKDDEF
jgi:hypothetical protein